jgi:hypothetical protein
VIGLIIAVLFKALPEVGTQVILDSYEDVREYIGRDSAGTLQDFNEKIAKLEKIIIYNAESKESESKVFNLKDTTIQNISETDEWCKVLIIKNKDVVSLEYIYKSDI